MQRRSRLGKREENVGLRGGGGWGWGWGCRKALDANCQEHQTFCYETEEAASRDTAGGDGGEQRTDGDTPSDERKDQREGEEGGREGEENEGGGLVGGWIR